MAGPLAVSESRRRSTECNEEGAVAAGAAAAWDNVDTLVHQFRRSAAFTGTSSPLRQSLERLPPQPKGPLSSEDAACIRSAIESVLLQQQLRPELQERVVSSVWERSVKAGEILIQQGCKADDEMYIVKAGKFEVLEARPGHQGCTAVMRCNLRQRGEVFGELSCLFSVPRTATVAATTDGAVFVLDGALLREARQASAEEGVRDGWEFLNSVPLLSPLSRQSKMKLVDALSCERYPVGSEVRGLVGACWAPPLQLVAPPAAASASTAPLG